MKKLFAILAVLSLLMVPCVSMASTMSDADLADVTGQMGVTIIVGNLNLGVQMGEILWGDADGFSTASFAGYVNMITPMLYGASGPTSGATPFIMNVGIQGLAMTIDVGTFASDNLDATFDGTALANRTAVKIGVKTTGAITVDAIAFAIFLNADKGADYDYASSSTHTNWGSTDAGYYQNSKMDPLTSSSKGGSFVDGAGPVATDCLGVFGVSHIRVTLPSTLDLVIMAH